MTKAYLWDWSVVPSEGTRFENLVASHLNKFCNLLEDREGYDIQLHYLRDRTGKELDFLVTVGRKPWFAVEAKLSETQVDPALRYFRDRLRIPWVYQVVRDAPARLRGGRRARPPRGTLPGCIGVKGRQICPRSLDRRSV